MIYQSSKNHYLALCYNSKINYILSKGLRLPKGPIVRVTVYIIQGSYQLYTISQTKKDSIYPAHIHTKQIIQAQSLLQMSMQLWYAPTKSHRGELIK